MSSIYTYIYIVYLLQGESLEPSTQKSAAPRKHGMQSLGKVPSARRPPANLPSLKAETLAPGDQSSTWTATGEGAPPTSAAATPATNTAASNSTAAAQTNSVTAAGPLANNSAGPNSGGGGGPQQQLKPSGATLTGQATGTIR